MTDLVKKGSPASLFLDAGAAAFGRKRSGDRQLDADLSTQPRKLLPDPAGSGSGRSFSMRGEPEIDPRFFAGEIHQVQAQLMLNEKTLGGWVRDASLPGLQWKRFREASQQRAQNWELLRQRAEEEGVYFEPLEMPEGSATHALLWVDRADVSAAPRCRFNGRFLNIASPWHDPKLADWEGFSEVRFFDSQNRPVSSETANARAAELIPLGLLRSSKSNGMNGEGRQSQPSSTQIISRHKNRFLALIKGWQRSSRCQIPLRVACLTTALAVLTPMTATSEIRRLVVVKSDGLPFDLVDLLVRKRDPRTGKSSLPLDRICLLQGWYAARKFLCSRTESFCFVVVHPRHRSTLGDREQRRIRPSHLEYVRLSELLLLLPGFRLQEASGHARSGTAGRIAGPPIC
jgi:hypothetical protein